MIVADREVISPIGEPSKVACATSTTRTPGRDDWMASVVMESVPITSDLLGLSSKPFWLFKNHLFQVQELLHLLHIQVQLHVHAGPGVVPRPAAGLALPAVYPG